MSRSSDRVDRRRALALMLLAAATPFAVHAQSAAAYPNRPIKLVVSFPGGVTDSIARVLAENIGQQLGTPVVVEARAGAGGGIGAKYVSSAPADGYTILLGSTSLVSNQVLHLQPEVDATRDLTAIAPAVSMPYVLVVNDKKPWRTLQELLGSARATPGKLNYSSNGTGTGPHFMGELLNTAAGIKTQHIPYKGGAEQINSLLAGDVDYAFVSLVTAVPQIASGRLRGLAVTSAVRASTLKNVPTLAEQGLSSVPPVTTWFALFGPANLPAHLRDLLAQQIRIAVAAPVMQRMVGEWGASVDTGSTSDLQALLRREQALWTGVAQTAGLNSQL